MSVNLKEYLRDILPQEELDLVVRSYDVVGDMAVIIVPPELVHRERIIGEAILDNLKHIKVVAKRNGLYSGEFRTIPLEVIAGENRKETVHREYGVNLLVNPEAVYFSVRSGTERKRIADQVSAGEEVLVLFSGIAPYPLVIAKNSRAREIVGIEKNPAAHRFGLANLAGNRKLKNIRLYCGDVAEILPSLARTFDRIVMPLPKGGEHFLPIVFQALRSSGILHYYDMRHENEFDESVAVVMQIAQDANRMVRSTTVVKCGHCAPRTYRICVDCRID
ncbi:class I SAM-dependent methyltransferase [Desulfopila aestuarii]|uniref:Methyltransferase n=1 Tax=Desulfopila aestuarii DSM 18488 TaxID=1121416 RepID=A0A1M7XVK7_9BACT|nr:hypothetical protein [Desulfopila aestuarii]SHO42611.1 methyltransferase [Desulfopila aestuarii DSM 18488]